MKKILFAISLLFVLINFSVSQSRVSGIGFKDRFDKWSTSSPNTDGINITNLNLFQNPQSIEDKPSIPLNLNIIKSGKFKQSNIDNKIITVQFKERELPVGLYFNNDLIEENDLEVDKIAYRILSNPDLKTKMKIVNENNFKIVNIEKDDIGITHIKMDQLFKNRLIFGGQIYVHLNNSKDYHFINGKWFKDPKFGIAEKTDQMGKEDLKYSFTFDKSKIFELINEDLEPSRMTVKKLRGIELEVFGGDQTKIEEMYLPDENTGDLIPVYVAEVKTDLLHGYKYLINAQSGDIIRKQSEHCSLIPENKVMTPDGGVKATGKDLHNVTREFNAYEKNGTYFMLDISRPMFNQSGSTLPDDPSGAIWTLNANNTYPNNNDFESSLNHVSSSNLNSWNATAVSAHYNASYAFEYYVNKFGRNSIDGKGGNVLSIMNVSDEDGSGMDNAFWGGTAMFYGNGKKVFTAPLAKALDVAGHEMTHGVIQNTANLEYYSESGAINESFADVFGVLMDRDDWKLGEDVVSLQYFNTGALRDMSNPHNGGANANGYQPAHYSEKYTGTEDNGGVHINSGIPNFAFYKFATKVGKDVAEKVYYKALTSYLTKSSDFKDLRVAVETAANDLYGADTKNAASEAFEAVGIGSSGGTGSNDQTDLGVNPGGDFILCTDQDYSALYLMDGNGNFLVNSLSNTGLESKPSVTDDGRIIVFVGKDKKIHFIQIDWNTGNFSEDILEDNPVWRNAVIAKDGSLLAALSSTLEDKVLIYNFALEQAKEFTFYNPSTAQGIELSNVLFADAMEFNHSGEWLMYDCKNSLGSGGFFDESYWDIGFLNVWNNKTKNFADGRVEKLFSGLEENESVGNPVFSKNSPYIIAFDYSDGSNYVIYGANIEKGNLGQIYSGSDYSYPNFSRDDKKLIFNDYDFWGVNLASINLDATKIQPQVNSEKILKESYGWGVWFSNGVRKLTTPTIDIFADNLNETTVFPNPVHDNINIISSNFKSGAKANLYDLLGNKILSSDLSFENRQSSIALNGTANGVYILKIDDGKNVFTEKILIFNK